MFPASGIDGKITGAPAKEQNLTHMRRARVAMPAATREKLGHESHWAMAKATGCLQSGCNLISVLREHKPIQTDVAAVKRLVLSSAARARAQSQKLAVNITRK